MSASGCLCSAFLSAIVIVHSPIYSYVAYFLSILRDSFLLTLVPPLPLTSIGGTQVCTHTHTHSGFGKREGWEWHAAEANRERWAHDQHGAHHSSCVAPLSLSLQIHRQIHRL